MMCLSSLFNLNKTIQATAYLLKQHENKMNHLRLLKLLYLINREVLKEDGHLTIYDCAYALPSGPVLSTVYRLIKRRVRSRDSGSNISKLVNIMYSWEMTPAMMNYRDSRTTLSNLFLIGIRNRTMLNSWSLRIHCRSGKGTNRDYCLAHKIFPCQSASFA